MKRHFNWQTFFAAIGEHTAEIAERDQPAMTEAVRSMLVFLLEMNEAKPIPYRTIAHRLLGLAWTLDPSLIEGSPSLSGIARQLDCHKVVLSIHSAAAHRRFGIRNRAQSHGWNFKPTLVAPAETESEDHNDG